MVFGVRKLDSDVTGIYREARQPCNRQFFYIKEDGIIAIISKKLLHEREKYDKVLICGIENKYPCSLWMSGPKTKRR